jgi:hypothetical protein
MLERVLVGDRPPLFEHWTHDAAIVPSAWFPHWRHKFERHRRRIAGNAWWRARLGDDPAPMLASLGDRIRAGGALQARELARPGRAQAWWGWTREKAALEYLWHTGQLAIARRVHFQKVYDLTERVLPHVVDLPAPDRPLHVDWACRTALLRLGVATAREIATFFDLVDLDEARAWCTAAAACGEIRAVRLEAADGSRPQPAWAVRDWEKQLRDAPAAPARIRILAPFDPVVWDRRRTRRLFGFDYAFEAFVPAPKRRWGYYVLPLLEGDRFVGRLDPEVDRDTGTLAVRRVWWEPGVRQTTARRCALAAALERLAALAGLERVATLR